MSEKITGKYLTDRLYRLQMILKDNSDMMDEAGAEIIILRRKNIELRATIEAKDAELAEAKKALRYAAGELSTYGDYTTKPPHEVYDNLIAAARIDAAREE